MKYVICSIFAVVGILAGTACGNTGGGTGAGAGTGAGGGAGGSGGSGGGAMAAIGDPCSTDTDCGPGRFCSMEFNEHGGECLAPCQKQSDCPSGSSCTDNKNCYKNCSTVSDCRTGYACVLAMSIVSGQDVRTCFGAVVP